MAVGAANEVSGSNTQEAECLRTPEVLSISKKEFIDQVFLETKDQLHRGKYLYYRYTLCFSFCHCGLHSLHSFAVVNSSSGII